MVVLEYRYWHEFMLAIETNLFERFSDASYRSSNLERPGCYVAFAGDAIDPHPILLLESLEVLIERTPVEIRPSPLTTTTEALIRLTQASNPDKIGEFPVLAAINTEENKGNSELELFRAFFLRDAESVATDVMDDFPEIARTTIRTAAKTQGVETHHSREEERGKMVHEARPEDDPIAKRITGEKGWGWPYYGAIDSTPRFITLVESYMDRQGSSDILTETYTDKNGEEHTILYATSLALDWIEGCLKKSPKGMLEFKKVTAGGIENQVWRDSREAYHHADGRLADNTYGIASFSTQIDTYKALKAASRLFPEKSVQYLKEADELQANILDFWVEDERGGYFALGAERQHDDSYRLLKIRTSDMGHILDSDLLKGEDPQNVRMRDMLVETIFSPEMLATSGIRSLGSNELRYSEGGYHNGSVWARENIIIARGLERYGYAVLAHELHIRNVRPTQKFGIFPEKVLGNNTPEPKLSTRTVDVEEFGRGKYRKEQPGQLMQAWTVSSVHQSLKSIEAYEPNDRLTL